MSVPACDREDAPNPAVDLAAYAGEVVDAVVREAQAVQVDDDLARLARRDPRAAATVIHARLLGAGQAIADRLRERVETDSQCNVVSDDVRVGGDDGLFPLVDHTPNTSTPSLTNRKQALSTSGATTGSSRNMAS